MKLNRPAPMTDTHKTVARAVKVASEVLAGPLTEGKQEDAFRLFFFAMMELGSVPSSDRDFLLRALLQNTDRPIR